MADPALCSKVKENPHPHSINISTILTSLQVPEVADQFRYHKVKFLAMAKEWMDKHPRHQQGSWQEGGRE